MKNEKMFTTGDFAVLCGTTRDTLYHYDEIGLLRPERVASNGYRLYSLTQYKEFELINLLRQIDMPLEEIRQLMRNRTSDSVREQLQRKRQEIDELIGLLRWEQRAIDYYADGSLYAESVEYDVPWIEHRPREYIAVTPLPGKREWTNRTLIRAIRAHFALCSRYSQIDHLPIGWIASGADVLNGRYQEKFSFSHMSEPLPEPFCRERPEGLYAVLVHKGENLEGCSSQISRLLRERNLELCGDAYITELVNFFNARGREDYVLEIAVPVQDRRP